VVVSEGLFALEWVTDAGLDVVVQAHTHTCMYIDRYTPLIHIHIHIHMYNQPPYTSAAPPPQGPPGSHSLPPILNTIQNTCPTTCAALSWCAPSALYAMI
jgi:hypothetical protein